jgi:hypothetical protein
MSRNSARFHVGVHSHGKLAFHVPLASPPALTIENSPQTTILTGAITSIRTPLFDFSGPRVITALAFC